MKELLCKAFCDGLQVRRVPAGLAVATPFRLADGDPVAFYVIERDGAWRIEDDGEQVPLLETAVDISRGRRKEAFVQLLAEYGATFDAEARTLVIGPCHEAEVPAAALRFTALLLRLHDIALLSRQSVRTTFREDVLAAMKESFGMAANISEAAPVSDKLENYPADVVVTADKVPPMAVYFGTSDEAALRALVLKMETEKYREIPCHVVLLLEQAKENPLREPTYALAQARLDKVLSYRGAEADALLAMRRMVGLAA